MGLKSQYSVRSIKNFIKFFVGINETPWRYHQTLTTKENLQDFNQAKVFLNRFLKNVHKGKGKQMASFYVIERQNRGAFHFHVVSHFFDSHALPFSQSEMTPRLKTKFWKAWLEVIGKGNVVRHGNRFWHREEKDLNYLLKDIELLKGSRGRVPHWWGHFNRTLFKLNSRTVPRTEVNSLFKDFFKKIPKSVVEHPRERYTKKSLEFMKEYGETTGAALEWDSFKRIELGVKRRVSDAEYLDFLNKEGIYAPKKRSGRSTNIPKDPEFDL